MNHHVFIHFQFPGPRVKSFSITSCLYHFPCGMGRQIFNRTFFPWQSGMTHSEEPWMNCTKTASHSFMHTESFYTARPVFPTHDWQESLCSLQLCSGPYGSNDDTLEGNCNCRVTVCCIFPKEASESETFHLTCLTFFTCNSVVVTAGEQPVKESR